MISLLFWNLNKKALKNSVTSLVIKNQIDFNNAIENNIAEDIRLGVFLYSGRDNVIKNNTANIQLVDSDRNTVAGNTGWIFYGTSVDP
jgi:parallel beta-helix repeat protein